MPISFSSDDLQSADLDRKWLECDFSMHSLYVNKLTDEHQLQSIASSIGIVLKNCPTMHSLSVDLALANGRLDKAFRILLVGLVEEKNSDFDFAEVIVLLPNFEAQRIIYKVICSFLIYAQKAQNKNIESDIKRQAHVNFKKNKLPLRKMWTQVQELVDIICRRMVIRWQYHKSEDDDDASAAMDDCKPGYFEIRHGESGGAPRYIHLRSSNFLKPCCLD